MKILRYAIACIFSAALSAFAQDSTLQDVINAFQSSNIPKNANIAFDPSVLLGVSFLQADETGVRVHAGISLPRNGRYSYTLWLHLLLQSP